MLTGFLRETLINDEANGRCIEDSLNCSGVRCFHYESGAVVSGTVTTLRTCFAAPFFELITSEGVSIKAAPGQLIYANGKSAPICSLKPGYLLKSIYKTDVWVSDLKIWRVGASVVSVTVDPYCNFFVKDILVCDR